MSGAVARNGHCAPAPIRSPRAAVPGTVRRTTRGTLQSVEWCERLGLHDEQSPGVLANDALILPLPELPVDLFPRRAGQAAEVFLRQFDLNPRAVLRRNAIIAGQP